MYWAARRRVTLVVMLDAYEEPAREGGLQKLREAREDLVNQAEERLSQPEVKVEWSRLPHLWMLLDATSGRQG